MLLKRDAVSKLPLANAEFTVKTADGTAIGANNGEFLTDRNGQIKIDGLTPGVTITAREIETVSGFVLDSTPQSILIKAGEAQTLNFYNQAIASPESPLDAKKPKTEATNRERNAGDKVDYSAVTETLLAFDAPMG